MEPECSACRPSQEPTDIFGSERPSLLRGEEVASLFGHLLAQNLGQCFGQVKGSPPAQAARSFLLLRFLKQFRING